MFKTPTLLLAASTLAIAGCASPDITESGFYRPSEGIPSATPVTTLIDIKASGVLTISDTTVVSYGVGLSPWLETAETAKAVAGLNPAFSVIDHQTSGTASYTGVYALAYMQNVKSILTVVSGSPGYDSGNITLTANFDAGTITGNSGHLNVDGTFVGQNLGGSVEYNGVEGELGGLIGQFRTAGIFHGNDSDFVYAGGFLANRD